MNNPALFRLPARAAKAILICTVLASCFLTGCSAKAKLQRHVERGDEFFEKKDYERARLEYLNAYRQQPNNPHIVARLGTIFFERGEPGPAAQFLMRAKELQPTNLVARASLASLLSLAREFDKAREEAEYILKQDPSNGDAFVILAGIASGTNEVQSTLQRFQRIAETQPNNAFLHLAIGNLHLRMRDVQAAEASFKKAEALDAKSAKFQLALAAVYWLQGQTNEADIKFKAATDLSPVKSSARLRWADYKLKTGQIEAGKKILEEGIEKAPDFIPALNALAQIAMAEKRTNDCAILIDKVLDQEPNNYSALLARARLRAAQNDLVKAFEDLETLSKLYPRDATLPYQMAVLQLSTNDSVRALTTLDRAIEINTNLLDAVLLRSEIQIAKGDTTAAITTLTKVSERNPEVTRSLYLLAQAYRKRGAGDEAIRTYQKIAEVTPKDPQAPYLAGTVYRQLGRTNEARRAYETALTIAPQFVPPIDELIELDVIAGNFDSAHQRVDGYIQQYPDKPVPYFLRAKILATQKRNNEAEAALLKALEIAPDYQQAHNSLAQIYISSDQPEKAVQKLTAMLEKNPKDLGVLLQLGMLYEKIGQTQKAVEIYESALKINPKFGPALNNLAYIYGESGQNLDRAYQLAREARALTPNDPFTSDTLGWIMYKRGDYAGALPLIQQSADRLDQAEVLYHLGMVHYMMGHENHSRTALTQALDKTKEANATYEAAAKTALQTLEMDPVKADAAMVATLEKQASSNPRDLFAHLRLAQIAMVQNQNDQAKERFEQALKANPKAAIVLTYYAAFTTDRLNDKAKGLELARQARAASQESGVALELGRIALRAGDYQWASPILEEAQRAMPDNVQANFLAGLASFGAGQIREAQNDLARATQSKENSTHKELARRLLTLVQYFERPSAPAPNVPTVTAELLQGQPDFPPALLVSGMLEESKDNFTAAKAAYENALAVAPGFLPAQRQLAILLAEKLPDDNRAWEIGSKIRAQFPEDAALFKALGKIAYRRGDYRDAARLLKESANRSAAQDADLLYHLGLAQHQIGDRQAKRSLTDAVSLDANSKLAADARKALAELK